MKALGCDGSTSLSSWLETLGLGEYLHNFLSSGYRTLDCVKNLWELEIVNVNVLFMLVCKLLCGVSVYLIHWPFFLIYAGVENWPSWSQKKNHSLNNRATAWGSTFKIQPIFPNQGNRHHDFNTWYSDIQYICFTLLMCIRFRTCCLKTRHRSVIWARTPVAPWTCCFRWENQAERAERWIRMAVFPFAPSVKDHAHM